MPVDQRSWSIVDGTSGRTLTHFRLPSEPHWILSAKGDTAASLSGIIDPVVARVSLSRARLDWCRTLPNEYAQPIGEWEPKLDGNQLCWTRSHDLLTVDLASGRARRAYHSQENSLRYLGSQDARVLLASHPDYDPSAWQLEGLSGGRRVWQHRVEGKAPGRRPGNE